MKDRKEESAIQKKSPQIEESKYVQNEETKIEAKNMKECIIEDPLGLADCWKVVTKDYLVIKQVGEGAFGKVYMAKCKTTRLKVAIKHMDDFSDHYYGLVKVIRELKIMR